MPDDLQAMDPLAGRDARLVVQMARGAGCSAEAMLREIVRSYLGLVRAAPEALPRDPMRALTSDAIRKGGGA